MLYAYDGHTIVEFHSNPNLKIIAIHIESLTPTHIRSIHFSLSFTALIEIVIIADDVITLIVIVFICVVN